MSLRQAEVNLRQKLVGLWLTQNKLDAVILTDPDAIAWFTAGGRCHPSITHDWANPALFITPTSRCLVCSADQSERMFREELDNLGFQVKPVPWTQPVRDLLVELCDGRKVACDVPFEPTVCHGKQLGQLRMVLTDYDVVRLRQLAAQVSHAVEATCRQLQPGDTECEIHGHLSHRLLRHDIHPVAVHIFADERADVLAAPRPRTECVRSYCTVLVTAKSRGLHVTTSRTVSFGKASKDLQDRFRIATIAAGTLLRFSQAGERACNVIGRALRVFQKNGHEFCWRNAALGSHAGYVYRCFPMTPSTQGHLRAQTAISWMPQVAGVVSAETVLVRQEGPEVLHSFEDWPIIGVSLREMTIDRPDILVR